MTRTHGVAPALAVTLALAATVALAGCGLGGASADLFGVRRSGTVAGAKLQLVVNDGGAVRCNDGPSLRISGALLLRARQIQADLQVPAKQGLSLPAGRGSVFAYSVVTPDGHVRFTDTSRGQPQVFYRLAELVFDLARGTCHLPT